MRRHRKMPISAWSAPRLWVTSVPRMGPLYGGLQRTPPRAEPRLEVKRRRSGKYIETSCSHQIIIRCTISIASGGNSDSARRTFLHRLMFNPCRKHRRRHVDRPAPPVRRKIRIPLQISLERAHTYAERIRHGFLADEPVTQRNILPHAAHGEIAEYPLHTCPGIFLGSLPTASPRDTPPCTRTDRSVRRESRCRRSIGAAHWRSRT